MTFKSRTTGTSKWPNIIFSFSWIYISLDDVCKKSTLRSHLPSTFGFSPPELAIIRTTTLTALRCSYSFPTLLLLLLQPRRWWWTACRSRSGSRGGIFHNRKFWFHYRCEKRMKLNFVKILDTYDAICHRTVPCHSFVCVGARKMSHACYMTNWKLPSLRVTLPSVGSFCRETDFFLLVWIREYGL